MTHLPLLSLLVWLPILGGVFTLMAGNTRPQAARWIALAFAIATFAVSIPLFTGFDPGASAMQFVEQKAWIPAYDIQYHLGADGISVALIVIGVFLFRIRERFDSVDMQAMDSFREERRR